MHNPSVAAPHMHRVVLAAGLIVLAAPRQAAAQQQGRAPVANPGAGIVVGVVVDTLGRAMVGASVSIESGKLQTETSADGTFRFSDVRGDTVMVVARWIGYYPQSRHVVMGKHGGSVLFELTPHPASLPTVVTEATLSGIRGVVSDTSYRALAGAQVQAMGSTAGIVTTDSGGVFFLDVKPGQYMLRVTSDRHQPEMVSVTVPLVGGRRVAVRLMPGSNPYHARMAWAADGLRERLEMRSAAWSKVFTREDIARLQFSDVTAIALAGASQRVKSDCEASVDGLSSAPLWAIDPDEVEFMEVYVRMPIIGVKQSAPRGITSINGNTSSTMQKRDQLDRPRIGADCPQAIMIWTRK